MPGEKILLVDDDPTILDLLSRFLGGQGFEVTAAPDGRQALEAIAVEEFPLALLDLKLPDMSGLNVLSHLKTRSPETEVILFTGLGALDSAVQALRLGAYDYLVKSELRLPELLAVVERALERRRLTLSNRELLDDLRQAQAELARQRAQELVQIRRIGEALARPLTPEQLVEGLIDLIWEGLSLAVLGLQIHWQGDNPHNKAYQRHPDLPRRTFQSFKDWLNQELISITPGSPTNVGKKEAPRKKPLKAMLQEKVEAGGVLGLVAAGRDQPFTPEETELFRIFALQGEAALKNLLLFEEVKSLAIRDGLTGLYNHRHFWEILPHEVEQSRRYQQPLSLLFLDIDNFKIVNDTYGHHQGDVVLKTMAHYLQKTVRHADFLCRYGGEEFVALLPQTPPEQARTLAERLRAGIARMPIPLAEGKMLITVSIGVAGLETGMDGESLVKAADAALYRAKQAGKNRVRLWREE
ncbi:MAG: diguanylate cyclase [Thermodesulfobacteriota bacterium]